MHLRKRISLYFLMLFLLFFAVSPTLTINAAAIDEPSAQEVLRARLVRINQRFPTLSFVSLKLGDYLNLLSAEYLLGKATDSSGTVKQGNLRIEQINFEHGIITTRQDKIWTIRVTESKITSAINPIINRGGVGVGDTESKIIEFYGNPLKIEKIFPSQKTLIYANGQNYVKFDISETTHKVIAFEIGLM